MNAPEYDDQQQQPLLDDRDNLSGSMPDAYFSPSPFPRTAQLTQANCYEHGFRFDEIQRRFV